MTNPASLTSTDDWIVSIDTDVSVSFVVSLGGQAWGFFSPRLRYACMCIVPRLGAGFTLGVNLPGGSIMSLIDRQASDVFKMDQTNVTVLRPFSANSLSGGSIASFSVGARGVVAGAEGHKTMVKARTGREIVRVRGGSVSLGLGVSLNMGTVTMGTMYGPFEIRTPIMKARRTER